MKVLLINPPYLTWTSRVGAGHQVPLGLLMVGGALLDDGHEVRLLDAERKHLSLEAIAREVRAWRPDVVMTGHAGSTPAHPTCMAMLRAIKAAYPHTITVYGGVFPTYHATAILEGESFVDVIVRGEGEATALELMAALRDGHLLEGVAGITYREADAVRTNAERPPIKQLDDYRVGWELIENWDDYQCFGMGRAAIVQLSRGCPHRCTYCGQHGFWVSWRYRDPIKLVDEIEWLYREHGVRFVTLADENPTTLQPMWKRFLEELASRKLPVHCFATIRATDIVRDEQILPLYRRAGLLYILMGIESTNPQVLKEVRKGSTTRHDFLACRLLRQHGIFSVLGHIVGLEDETRAAFRVALRQLRHYDGDYLNAMYVTPHSWTPFARDTAERPVVQPDQSKWDYRHQILGQKFLSPVGLFLGVKWLELRFHLRPRALLRMVDVREPFVVRQRWWTLFHTGMVWFAEIGEFVVDEVRKLRGVRCPTERRRVQKQMKGKAKSLA